MTTELDVRPPLYTAIIIGALGGFMSGLFGVGGGIIIVPLLVTLAGMSQRLAAGTSIAAIFPAAVAGAVSYGVQGNIVWPAALLLAVGIVAGALIGSKLLSVVPTTVLRWIFLGFLLAVIVSLWFLVPVLMFFFGMDDLNAKGTSLFMMIPGALTGTLSNVRRKVVDLRTGVLLGLTAMCVSPLGAWTAGAITPQAANIGFSVFLAATFLQQLVRMLRARGQR